MVVSGSLTKGIEIRLDGSVSVEDIAVGRYVTIAGGKQRFFGMITDVALEASDPRIVTSPPDVSDPFIAEVISGTSTYGRLHVLPALTIGSDAHSLLEGPQPVKTVPSHFSLVHEASEQDVAQVFGQVEEKQFYIGTPLDMETKVRLNPAELVKRSNGVLTATKQPSASSYACQIWLAWPVCTTFNSRYGPREPRLALLTEDRTR
jgi:hypothetical protein